MKRHNQYLLKNFIKNFSKHQTYKRTYKKDNQSKVSIKFNKLIFFLKNISFIEIRPPPRSHTEEQIKIEKSRNTSLQSTQLHPSHVSVSRAFWFLIPFFFFFFIIIFSPSHFAKPIRSPTHCAQRSRMKGNSTMGRPTIRSDLWIEPSVPWPPRASRIAFTHPANTTWKLKVNAPIDREYKRQRHFLLPGPNPGSRNPGWNCIAARFEFALSLSWFFHGGHFVRCTWTGLRLFSLLSPIFSMRKT